MTTRQIPFIDLVSQKERLKDSLDRAWQNVLAHGRYVMGPEVFDLEEKLQDFGDVEHVISCASGTDALFMSLMALDIRPGDAVFVPSFTFAATAEVVALIGATPVFVDVEPDTFNMCLKNLEQAIDYVERSTSLKMRAAIAVDLFGQPADHREIDALLAPRSMALIVDAAQSAGAEYYNKSTLSYGVLATTSFFPAKPLGGFGDGGAIFTNDEILAERLQSIRVHGQGETRYQNVRLGVTGRLDTLQAAILLEKLKIFPEEIQARQAAAERYTELLKGHVKTPVIKEGRTSVWAQYTIQVEDRDHVQKALAERGVPSMIYYPEPLHTQIPYKNAPREPQGLVATNELAKTVLSLPMHAYLKPEDQECIVEQLLSVLR